jgi:hypothetical protein
MTIAVLVEVVGGLVQQQQLGLGEQAGGQRHPHAPAAGELRHRAGQVGLAEAEAGEDLGGAGGRPVGVDVDQAVVDVAHLLGRGGFEPAQQAGALDVGLEHGVQQRHRRRRVLLVDGADPRLARERDLARAGDELALDEPEEGGLADAVAADEADLGVLGQGDARLVEEPAAPGVEYEVVDLEHGRVAAGSLPELRAIYTSFERR